MLSYRTETLTNRYSLAATICDIFAVSCLYVLAYLGQASEDLIYFAMHSDVCAHNLSTQTADRQTGSRRSNPCRFARRPSFQSDSLLGQEKL